MCFNDIAGNKYNATLLRFDTNLTILNSSTKSFFLLLPFYDFIIILTHFKHTMMKVKVKSSATFSFSKAKHDFLGFETY